MHNFTMSQGATYKRLNNKDLQVVTSKKSKEKLYEKKVWLGFQAHYFFNQSNDQIIELIKSRKKEKFSKKILRKIERKEFEKNTQLFRHVYQEL